MLSVVACLRLEIAIPLPDNDEDAANLLALALCSCTVMAILVGLFVWCFPELIVSSTGQPGLRPFLWSLPLAIWLASAYVALTFWATRKKRFTAVAKTRVTQAVGSVGAQLAFGFWSGFGPFGLLLGQIISSGAGVFGLGRSTLALDRVALTSIGKRKMRSVWADYDRFPKYSTFDAFASSAGIQLPVIIIAAMAMGPDAGYLLLATRAMAAPLGLVGGAVSQVYLSRAPDEARAGRLNIFTAGVIGGLAKSGVGPLIFTGLVASALFPLVFGEKWGRAGEFVAWMTPWFVMQFLANPVSMAMHVTGSQRIALMLQIFGLALRVSAVGAIGFLMPKYIVEAYAVSGFLFYAVHFLVVVKLSKIRMRQLIDAIRPSALIVALWAIFGLTLQVGIRVLQN
jgi:O-antigen/teichoic acid export membrane protein